MVLHRCECHMHCNAVKVHSWVIGNVARRSYSDCGKTLSDAHRGLSKRCDVLGCLLPDRTVGWCESLAHMTSIEANEVRVYIADSTLFLYN